MQELEIIMVHLMPKPYSIVSRREHCRLRSFVVITHYQRLLDHVTPDRVHVLRDGKIVRSGDKELAVALEARGYEWITETGEDTAAEERSP